VNMMGEMTSEVDFAEERYMFLLFWRRVWRGREMLG